MTECFNKMVIPALVTAGMKKCSLNTFREWYSRNNKKAPQVISIPADDVGNTEEPTTIFNVKKETKQSKLKEKNKNIIQLQEESRVTGETKSLNPGML